MRDRTQATKVLRRILWPGVASYGVETAVEAVIDAYEALPDPVLEAKDREIERLKQERADFIAILGEDADGRMILDREQLREQLREGIKHPCALCGWTLDGHKYVYGTDRGAAHLHCSHTLRAVHIDGLKAELERLRAIGEAAKLMEDAICGLDSYAASTQVAPMERSERASNAIATYRAALVSGESDA